MSLFNSPKKLFTCLALTGLLLTPLSASAQSNACKGQIEKSCSTSTSCSWVKSYKKSNGTSVKGYCRKKPGSTATTKAKSEKQDTTAKRKAQETKTKSSASTTAKKPNKPVPPKKKQQPKTSN